MPLTNAERQKRFRERRRADPPGVAALTAEQRADRNAMMSEPLWPVPTGSARDQMPTFMGWNRYDWSVAPAPMTDFFGLRKARDGWDGERDAMQSRMDQISRERQHKADRIVAECGDVARRIMQEGGILRLFQEYEADPTLGRKQRRPLR